MLQLMKIKKKKISHRNTKHLKVSQNIASYVLKEKHCILCKSTPHLQHITPEETSQHIVDQFHYWLLLG